jgi:hypothetical protein
MENKIELFFIKTCTWQQTFAYVKELGEGWAIPKSWQFRLMQRAAILGYPDFQQISGWFWTSTPYEILYFGVADGSSSIHTGIYYQALCIHTQKGYWGKLADWIEEQEERKNARAI